MPIGNGKVVKSRSNGRLIDEAVEFLSAYSEAVLLAPTQSAGEDLVHRLTQRGRRGSAGIHRLTPVQFASDLARPAMARLGLAPVTSLGVEAIAARIAAAALNEKQLDYFEPVAALPGFARALARTVSELRMNRVPRAKLAGAGAPGADLTILLNRYEDELKAGGLA